MNGGPAFPQCVATDHDGQRVCSFDFVDGAGMDLRDYFAAHAAACLWHHNFLTFAMNEQECQQQIQNAAVLSYRIADAMLEARKS